MVNHKNAKKYLGEVSEKEKFSLHMGCNIATLKELDEALDIIAQRTFSHHVNDKKNDFAVWIREAVGDKELADKVGPIRDREKFAKTIKKRVEELEKIKEAGELNSEQFMRNGIADFSIGAIIGFIVGLIIAMIL